MNLDLYNNFDSDFDKACGLCDSEFKHSELISMLSSGNIQQKQYAALNIKELVNNDEIEIFLNNLTGCDGKIREAVAFKMLELTQTKKNYYIELLNRNPEYTAKIFADATIDINANICRQVIDCVKFLNKNTPFCYIYVKYIIKFINEAFENLDRIVYKDKKYTINKQLFKLYWCLEALKYFTEYVSDTILYKILDRSSRESEYTIREKTAQILLQLNNQKFYDLKTRLIQDNNYYVQRVFQI